MTIKAGYGRTLCLPVSKGAALIAFSLRALLRWVVGDWVKARLTFGSLAHLTVWVKRRLVAWWL